VNIASHLPALQVVVPLVSAPICALLRSGERPAGVLQGRIAWGIACTVSWAMLIVAWLLFEAVRNGGSISYEFGGWPPRGASSTA